MASTVVMAVTEWRIPFHIHTAGSRDHAGEEATWKKPRRAGPPARRGLLQGSPGAYCRSAADDRIDRL